MYFVHVWRIRLVKVKGNISITKKPASFLRIIYTKKVLSIPLRTDKTLHLWLLFFNTLYLIIYTVCCLVPHFQL